MQCTAVNQQLRSRQLNVTAMCRAHSKPAWPHDAKHVRPAPNNHATAASKFFYFGNKKPANCLRPPGAKHTRPTPQCHAKRTLHTIASAVYTVLLVIISLLNTAGDPQLHNVIRSG